jgi:hypothetical protein
MNCLSIAFHFRSFFFLIKFLIITIQAESTGSFNTNDSLVKELAACPEVYQTIMAMLENSNYNNQDEGDFQTSYPQEYDEFIDYGNDEDYQKIFNAPF